MSENKPSKKGFSMKDMASKVMKKADRFLDRVVETSTTDGEKYLRDLKNSKGYAD